MVSSGPSPLVAVRDGMWGFLLFAAVAWLAIAWSVLRLQPTDLVQVAGPVVLFGALMEAVRALAGTRTWWLNAGMAVLFAATGIVLLAGPDSSFSTPAALVGWFLMVRGAADIAAAVMSRDTDRIWGLVLVAGLAEAGLGFFAASPAAVSVDQMVSVLGALGFVRGVVDLVTALRLREVPRLSLLELPPEREAGMAGYSAGLTDFESMPSAAGARHRAAATPKPALDTQVKPGAGAADEPATWHAAAGPIEPATDPVLGPSKADLGTGWATTGATPAGKTKSFHDEVLRTTADLDMMLALAGIAGAAVGVPMTHFDDLPEVPDTPEGVDLPKEAHPSRAEAPAQAEDAKPR